MGALQIALLAAQIFGTLEPIVAPYALAGINALITTLKSKKAAGQKMTFSEIHAMAAADHGVDMSAVYRGAAIPVAVLTLLGGAFAVRALRKL